MFELLTVCTGNICRSPLAELVLRTRLSDLAGVVRSAGTRALVGHRMPSQARALAERAGVPARLADDHRSRQLTAEDLITPDLILTMSRDQRGAVAQLDPTRLRSVFTIREFERLAAGTSDDSIRAALSGETNPSLRLRTAVALIASLRGVAPPPVFPDDDDVVDPFRRDDDLYRLSAAQLSPAIESVVRVVALAVLPC